MPHTCFSRFVFHFVHNYINIWRARAHIKIEEYIATPSSENEIQMNKRAHTLTHQVHLCSKELFSVYLKQNPHVAQDSFHWTFVRWTDVFVKHWAENFSPWTEQIKRNFLFLFINKLYNIWWFGISKWIKVIIDKFINVKKNKTLIFNWRTKKSTKKKTKMADSARKRDIPIKLGDFSVIDTEFSSIRERFDQEMRRMEDEMAKFRSDLMNRESNYFETTSRYETRKKNSRNRMKFC